MTTAAAYHTQYVLGDPGAFPLLLGCFFVASLVVDPALAAARPALREEAAAGRLDDRRWA